GDGAKLYGGRWNRIGTAVIYTSATRSLAAVEIIAHHRAIPNDFHIIVIEIPGDLAIEAIGLEELGRCRSEVDCAKFGTEWATSLRSPVLRVPSAAFPSEYNYLLNPLHSAFGAIRFNEPDTHIDPRLRQ